VPIVTATEFKTNLGHYLDVAADEDVFITRQGKVAGRLSDPARDRQRILDGLVGIIDDTPLTAKAARAERLAAA